MLFSGNSTNTRTDKNVCATEAEFSAQLSTQIGITSTKLGRKLYKATTLLSL
jgi:hypothetical protein